MYQLLEESSGNVFGFLIGDKITTEDMARMIHTLEEGIAKSGKVRVLTIIEGFRHMDPGALLEKLKFVKDNPHSIERMAVVSSRVWIKSWIKVGGLLPFHTEVEYFDRPELEAAWQWIRK